MKDIILAPFLEYSKLSVFVDIPNIAPNVSQIASSMLSCELCIDQRNIAIIINVISNVNHKSLLNGTVKVNQDIDSVLCPKKRLICLYFA